MSRRLFRTAPRQRRQAARSNADTRAAAAGAARVGQWMSAHVLPAAGLLIAALLLVFGGILLFGRQFQVHEVQVIGTEQLDAQALPKTADVFGRSILALNPARVEARLREAYLVIEVVDVGRELPDRVIIRVQEQPARWAWESGGRYWWLREDGSVIGELPEPGKLPVLHDIGALFSEPQAYVAGVPWELAAAMLEALPEIPAFDYGLSEGLIIYVTDKQWPVYLGTEGDARAKTELLRSAVKQLVQQQVEIAYIDLRNENKPVVIKTTQGA